MEFVTHNLLNLYKYIRGASWCNLTDDVTTCPMCHRVNNVRFGLGFR